jgi:DNA-binding MarR family transcriptional regulator
MARTRKRLIAKAGYVERCRCDADGCGQIIRIRADGKALQRKMWPIYRSVLEREFVLKLAEGDAERLAKLLDPLTSVTPAATSAASMSQTSHA